MSTASKRKLPGAPRADANWARYEYLRMRGHREWVEDAVLCEDMYEGGGKQWLDSWKDELDKTRRIPAEQNEIKPAVNTAVGYQISNRMEIKFAPRGHGADDETADTLGKVARQVSDNNKLQWVETEVFTDGMITGRGYFDIRMCFDDSVLGEIEITSLDPADAIPDPDGQSYNPDKGWTDITVTRWYTIDEIEMYYGADKAKAVLEYQPCDTDYNGWDEARLRSRFGTEYIGGNYLDASRSDVDTRRFRIIDRQYYKYEMCDVLVYMTGDVRVIPPDTSEEQIERWRTAGNRGSAIRTKRMMRRVMWLVTTAGVVLHDDVSPYPFFTIVPFFPYFRRGRTPGMVRDTISPQMILNKGISQGMHIFNSSAKGGWQAEEGQVTNMSTSEFKEQAGLPGLIIIRKVGSPKLEPITPPPMPPAINEFINRSIIAIKSVTGITDELNAQGSEGMSGAAIQARQYAAQQKLAIPLDNLARTRNMLASKMLWLIQRYMSAPQVLRITEEDELGGKNSEELPINDVQEDGSVINDLTIGEYDVMISEQPLAVTFDNTQFEQMKAIAEMLQAQGDTVPSEWLLRYSNIADKSGLKDAIEELRQQKANQPGDPTLQAKADLMSAQSALAQEKAKNAELERQLLAAQVAKTKNEATQAGVVAIYSATQAASEIASVPQIATIADEILGSAGFEDQDAPPIISQLPGAGAGLSEMAPPAPIPGVQPNQTTNTDPVTPAGPPSPRVGADRGIEKPGVQ